MSNDDHDENDQRKSRGDRDKPTRDGRGRWLPGHCPNLKGRPRKKPRVYLDLADIRIFGHTLVDVVANGQKETMDRRTALLNKMYESAMKGKVSQQRFLYKEFERSDERLAATVVHYERLMFDWYINNPVPGKPRVDIPFEVEVEMESLRTLLNYYFPSDYPLANDDGEGNAEVVGIQYPEH